MRRFRAVLILLLLFATVSFGQVKWPISSRNMTGDRLRRLLQNRFDLVENDVDSLMGLGQRGTGDFFYVDSGRSNAATIDGKSWIKAEPTWDDAVNNCTDNAGDYIIVAEGHAENLAAADAVDLDVIGVTTIFLGNGSNQGTLTYTGTAGEVVFAAANNLVIGGRYLAGISEVVHAFEWEDDADNCTLYGAFFPEPSGATEYEFDIIFDPSSGADGLAILNCKGFNADATGMSNVLDLSAGVNNDVMFANNIFIAECASPLIYSNQADKEVILENNRLTNLTAAGYAVQFTAATTGMATHNKFQTSVKASHFDSGAMYVDETNTWLDSDGSNDEVAVPSFGPVQDIYIAKTDGSLNASLSPDALFTITGGPILVESFIGIVTTGVGATPVIGNLQIDVTTPSADVLLSTQVTLTSDAAGTSYTFDGTNVAILTPITAGAVSGLTPYQWLCPIGTVEFSADFASDGVIAWYMMYRPLSADSLVVVAP